MAFVGIQCMRSLGCGGASTKELNTLRPNQNGRHFADDILKCIFLNENTWILIEISLKFVPKGSINNIPALVQIMAWCRQVTSHYLNQVWLVYWRIYASSDLNELTCSYLWCCKLRDEIIEAGFHGYLGGVIYCNMVSLDKNIFGNIVNLTMVGWTMNVSKTTQHLQPETPAHPQHRNGVLLQVYTHGLHHMNVNWCDKIIHWLVWK